MALGLTGGMLRFLLVSLYVKEAAHVPRVVHILEVLRDDATAVPQPTIQ